MIKKNCERSNLTKAAMEPFGKALKAYFQGNHEAMVVIERDDGYRDEHPVEYYFRDENQFSLIEKMALDTCEGKILDLGAGVGPHALVLQEKGFEIDALDINRQACQIMHQRGVNNVVSSSVFDLKDVKYDTILSLGRSLGFVGDLAGFEQFLNFAETITTSNGQILFDATDIRNPKDRATIHLNYQKNNIADGRYLGEIRFYIEYQGVKGEIFKMLQLDPDALAKCCKGTNWDQSIIKQTPDGQYLARLTRKTENP
jgi:2-polyprenyl-3-methyl-5-hydroxy-6-metoxy-1,4-benzoquinol methylase